MTRSDLSRCCGPAMRGIWIEPTITFRASGTKDIHRGLAIRRNLATTGPLNDTEPRFAPLARSRLTPPADEVWPGPFLYSSAERFRRRPRGSTQACGCRAGGLPGPYGRPTPRCPRWWADPTSCRWRGNLTLAYGICYSHITGQFSDVFGPKLVDILPG